MDDKEKKECPIYGPCPIKGIVNVLLRAEALRKATIGVALWDLIKHVYLLRKK